MSKVLSVPQISIKWHTVTCFEIKIGDKTIVIDPFIGMSPGTESTAEVVEGADIIPITHIHWDHVTDIAYLMDKFGSRVIVGDLSAMDLAKYLDRNPHYIYPVCHNTELDFSWVKIKALMGRHSDMRKNFLESAKGFEKKPFANQYPELWPLGYYGILEYRNYIITTPQNFKILVYGNTPAPEQLNMLKDEKPDIALLQFTRPIPGEIAEFARDIGAKILIPHHMDLAKTYDEYNPGTEELCRRFREIRPGGVAINPVHGKWYDVATTVTPRD